MANPINGNSGSIAVKIDAAKAVQKVLQCKDGESQLSPVFNQTCKDMDKVLENLTKPRPKSLTFNRLGGRFSLRSRYKAQ